MVLFDITAAAQWSNPTPGSAFTAFPVLVSSNGVLKTPTNFAAANHFFTNYNSSSDQYLPLTNGVALGLGQNNFVETPSGFSFLGGGEQNSIDLYSQHSVLVGGFNNTIHSNVYFSFIGGGQYNEIQDTAFLSAIVGGQQNSINNSSVFSFIGGGEANTIDYLANKSTIAGGYENYIGISCDFGVIAGGELNNIGVAAEGSVVVGGMVNSIQFGNTASFIGGGVGNAIQTNSRCSVIAGGENNVVFGDHSQAAGLSANATNNDAYVWGDANGASSHGDNSFTIGASNGVWLDRGIYYGNAAGISNAPYLSLTNNVALGVGSGNTITNNPIHCFIGGGGNNKMSSSATQPSYCFIGGGYNNSIGGFAPTYNSILGGSGNWISNTAVASAALGNNAHVSAQNAFVWGGAGGATDSGNDTFTIGSSGGLWLTNGGQYHGDAGGLTNYNSAGLNNVAALAGSGVSSISNQLVVVMAGAVTGNPSNNTLAAKSVTSTSVDGSIMVLLNTNAISFSQSFTTTGSYVTASGAITGTTYLFTGRELNGSLHLICTDLITALATNSSFTFYFNYCSGSDPWSMAGSTLTPIYPPVSIYSLTAGTNILKTANITLPTDLIGGTTNLHFVNGLLVQP